MDNINLKLKTYEQLQNEVITLNTNNYLKDLKIKDLQQRIDKAVEYIERLDLIETTFGEYFKDILNILKGEENE